MGLFGKTTKDPKDQVKEWTSTLRKQGYQLERQIKAIQREEMKVKKSLADAAKKGDTDVCKVLAKEIVRARKSINRIHTTKAQISSVQMSMNHQLGNFEKLVDKGSVYVKSTRRKRIQHSWSQILMKLGMFVLFIDLTTLRVAGSLEKSTEVMKSMQNLVKMPEVAKTMQEMSKEMMKAGIIEEMMEDTFEGLDPEELEEEAQEEVDKVLWELTQGQLGTAPSAVSDSLPEAEVEGATATTSAKSEDFADMQERLEALRS